MQMWFYTTKTDEEIAQEQAELRERTTKYYLAMIIADQMYHREIITIDEYYKVQTMFGEKYGITEKSIFWWNGPHEADTIEPAPACKTKKNRTYTKYNTEYWEKHKK